MLETAQKKGIHILGTGDITQPDWRKYLKDNLQYKDGCYYYKTLNFIIQTELEDDESIHHVVLLPDLTAGERLEQVLTPFVKDIKGRWAGRPHVQKSPAEVVELVESVGGICGPAHAFTPFKSIFRPGKFNSFKDAYGDAAKKVTFLELGLSADTYLADRIESLQDITFLSNSDAHSQGPGSLGREFNRFAIETPSFDEIRKGIERRQGRKIILNVGLDPQLGKYNIMFCKSCRRRARRNITPSSGNNPLAATFGLGKATFDDTFIEYRFNSAGQEAQFLKQVADGKVECIACKNSIQQDAEKSKAKKTFPKLSLGVSERINQIATWDKPHHPDHRAPYLDIIPLFEIVRAIQGISSKTSKTLQRNYDEMIRTFGTEFEILADISLAKLKTYENGKLAGIIECFRKHEIKITPGGGGTFGNINLENLEE